MAYTTTYGADAKSRASSLALVGLIHVGLAAALVTGLTVADFVKEEDPPFVATTVVTPKPPPVEVEPVKQESRAESVITAPDPVVKLASNPPVKVDLPTFDTLALIPTRIVTPVPGPQPSAAVGPRFDPIVAAPSNDIGSWVRDSDYSAQDIRMERQGTAKFQVAVAANGRVTSCEILRSSGHASLDRKTCDLIGKRARFDPARDDSGKKVSGTFSSSIRWRIPAR